MSPPDLSEAADSMNHFLSLLAGFLTKKKKKKKPFCYINIDHKGYILQFFFFTSHFSISMDSTCCSYNTLQLNIGGRSWGQKISIECVLNIEVFKIKMNHLIISCGQATA